MHMCMERVCTCSDCSAGQIMPSALSGSPPFFILARVFPCPGSVHFDGTDDDHLHGRRLLRLCLLGRLNTLQHPDGCVGSRLRHCACGTTGPMPLGYGAPSQQCIAPPGRLHRTAGPYGNGWQPAQVPRWVISMANVTVFLRTVPAYQIYRWARKAVLQCSIPTDGEQSAGWMLSVTGNSYPATRALANNTCSCPAPTLPASPSCAWWRSSCSAGTAGPPGSPACACASSCAPHLWPSSQ